MSDHAKHTFDDRSRHGSAWVFLIQPEGKGHALIIGEPNPQSIRALSGMFRSVVVWNPGHRDTPTSSGASQEFSENVEFSNTPYELVPERLSQNQRQYSLIVFDESLHRCRAKVAHVVECATRALTDVGQICLVSGNRVSVSRLGRSIANALRYPSIAQMRRAVARAGLVLANYYFPYPNSSEIDELLGWSRLQPRAKRQVAIHVLDAMGLNDLTHDCAILLAARVQKKSGLQIISENSLSDIDNVAISITECLFRPNGTLVVFFESEREEYVLRIPLNDDAHRRIEEAWSVLESIVEVHSWLRPKIPQKVGSGRKWGLPFYAESRVSGTSALELTSVGGAAKEVRKSAMSFLCQLGLSNGGPVVEHCLVSELTRKYLDPIESYAPRHAGSLQALGAGLDESFEQDTIPLITVHGDFNPTNVFLDNEGKTVTGVIDWDAAERNGPPLLDLIHFLRGCNRYRREMPIGKWLLDALTANIWDAEEQSLIREYMLRFQLEFRLLPSLTVLYWARHLYVHLKYSSDKLDADWEEKNIDWPLCRLRDGVLT